MDHAPAACNLIGTATTLIRYAGFWRCSGPGAPCRALRRLSGLRSPLSEFLDEVERRRPASRVVTVGRGETLPLPVAASWTG